MAQPQLIRAIGPKLLLFLIVGDVLGTGIYALTGDVAAEVGGAAWLAFGLAFFVAMCTAASYVELVGKFPAAAGAALYTQRAFSLPFVTFLVGFAVMSSGLTSASAASRSFAGYFQELAELPPLLLALGFLLVLAVINFRGVAESVRVNLAFTGIELAGLVLVIAAGLGALARGVGDAGRAFEFNVADDPFALVVNGAALAFFALVGFEDSVNMVEETRDPGRIFPRALFGGLAIAGVIYMLVAFCATAVVPLDVLGASDQDLLEVIRIGMPGFPLALFALIAMAAVSNSALINMMMASRLVYGMAREGVIASRLAAVHARRRTPWIAIAGITAIALGLASWGGVRSLGGATALLLLIVFTIVNTAVLVLRRRPVEHDHFRAPTVLPVIGIVSCGYLATPLSGREIEQYAVVGALLALGIVLWAINRFLLDGDKDKAQTIDP